jgi:diacylglycerol kinase family enzyme
MVRYAISGMKPIGCLFNPFAKLNKKQTKEQIRDIETVIGDYGLIRSTESSDKIPDVVKEFHKKGIKILCISGGDGTISSVISEYINHCGAENMPLIVPLKGGTMNFIAADTGLSFDQKTVCQKLIRRIRNDEQLMSVERGLIKVTDPRLVQPYYTFTWADGFIYRFMKWYYREGGGTSVALKLMLKSYIIYLRNGNHGLFRQEDSRVYIDDKRIHFANHLFIIAATVNRLVFGFRGFSEHPKAGERFNILYFRLPYFKKVLYKLPMGFYWGLNSDKSGNFLNLSVYSVKIEGNRGYIIDGEVMDTEKPVDIKLEMGPKIKILSLKRNT